MNIQEKLNELTTTLGQREFNLQQTMGVLSYDINTYWSWGVSQRVNFQNKGLGLKVSGNHHKGWVLITLSYMDTYSVHIVSNKGEVLNTYDDVYVNELVDIIDGRIERIEEYHR